MKLLHVHSGNLYGGVETMLVTLAATPGELEHRVALSFDGRLSEELGGLGVSVTRVGAVRFSRPWTVVSARRRLARDAERHRPDAIVVHSTWGHAAFGAVAAHAGIPLVHWLHAPAGGPSWLARWAERGPPVLVVCNSRYTCEARALLREVPAAVVYPPVSPPNDVAREGDFSRIRRELETPDDAVVVIQVGRFEPWKGHPLLLEALGALRGPPDWRCWMVGGVQKRDERRYADSLAARAKTLGIADRVRFLGERRDVPSLLRAADVFCQPNVAPEPFGIVFVEALYAGLPVVSTRLGGPLEIVDESCGVLVEPAADQLRATLEGLFDDAPRRRGLGGAAPERARQLCDPTRQSARLAAALRGVILRP